MSEVMIALFIAAAVGQAPKPTTSERLANDVKQMVTDSRAPADHALKDLKGLATADNFKSFGFATLDEVAQAELGKPLPVVIVRLDELRDFKPGDDPYRVLHPIPKVMYAVNVKDQARSSVEVEVRDGKWEATSFGATPLAQRHAAAVKKQAAQDRARQLFIIKVLALNRTYFAYQTDKGAYFIHVRWDDENADVKPQPAADVLTDLVKLAKEHDGSFR